MFKTPLCLALFLVVFSVGSEAKWYDNHFVRSLASYGPVVNLGLYFARSVKFLPKSSR